MTGDAIKCGEPFAVLLGDSITRGSTPCTKQLIDVYNTYNASAISVEEIPSIRWRGMESSMERKLKRMSTRLMN